MHGTDGPSMGCQLSGSLALDGADLGVLSETILRQERTVKRETPLMKRILIINGGSVLTHGHPQCPCFEAGSLHEVALLTRKEEKRSQT
jgi:hypothetical protein